MHANSLPASQQSPVHPFCSFVVNIQVASWGHRDPYDDVICLIIPIGSFTGGQLCLFEPGIIIDMKPGDVVVFPSSRITHFNLHFKGIRHSLVCQTDVHMKDWTERRNGWEPYINIT
jgi:hypothetical protein